MSALTAPAGEITVTLGDGATCRFMPGSWDEIGPDLMRHVAEENRAAQWREDEEAAQAAHEAFFKP